MAQARNLFKYVTQRKARVPQLVTLTASVISDYPLSAGVEPFTATQADFTAAGRVQYTFAKQDFEADFKRNHYYKAKVAELSE